MISAISNTDTADAAAGVCPPLFANAPEIFGTQADARDSFLPRPLEEEIRKIYERSPLYAKRFPLPSPSQTEPLTWARYREIPALSKTEIVERGHEAFFADYKLIERGLRAKKFEYESTSGTTAGPMTVIMEDGWWNEQTRRAYRAHPLLAPFADTPHRKCVLAPVGCSSNLCPYEDHPFPNRYFDGTVYLNLSSDPFVFPEAEWDRILIELQAVRPDIIEGEPIYLSLLARAAKKRRVSVPGVKVVILTYGKASLQHSRRVAEVFLAPQVDLYGSTEAGYIFIGGAFKDDSRVIDENAFVELAPYRGAADVFQIYVTTRGREAMPLLRYRTGDIVRRVRANTAPAAAVKGEERKVKSETPESETQTTGQPAGARHPESGFHSSPFALHSSGNAAAASGYRLLGREGGLYFRQSDGAIISPTEIDAAIPADFACWHYSLVQTADARWDFHYVADEHAPRGLEAAIAAALGDGARVNAFRRRSITPAASGKFALLKPLARS